MADTLSHATPKKLFKASSKTKTPTPAKRFTPSTSSSATPVQPSQSHRLGSQRTSRSTSVNSFVSQSTDATRKYSTDDVFQSTNLAPLTSSETAASGRFAHSIGSDTTGELPGLIDSDALSFTDTDTLSRTTDDRSSAKHPTGQFKGFSPSFKKKVSEARALSKKTKGKSVDRPNEVLRKSTSNLSEASSSVTDKPEPSIDLAKYFQDQGNPEMSQFVTALLEASENPAEIKRKIAEIAQQEPTGAIDPAEATGTTSRGSELAPSEKQSRGEKKFPGKNSTMQQPGDTSKKADGAFRKTKSNLSGAVPTNKIGEPDAARISRDAQPAIPSLDNQRSAKSPAANPDGTQEFDNMGRPAHIDRRIEIPLQRPQKIVQSPGQGGNAAEGDNAGGLGDVNDLRSTDDLRSINELRSTDDLPEIPDDESPDPPEEILDPSVHSSSASITPIPRIPKIAPIDSAPPVNLERLAKGLAGHVVDDVGNIVDESGNVLGHATGDLPSMVGKKVSSDGEIYGDGGEIIGYVCENFVNPPEPTEIPSEVLGGLKVDREGNILDSEGNVIGKFHQKPDQNGSLPPFMQSTLPKTEQKPKDEQKPKVNAQTGGSPSDIFLDVKSTTDGIQLTIRIPTTFSRPPQEQSQEQS